MKQYVGIIAALVAVLVGGVTLSNKVKEKTVEANRIEDFARIQQAYLERVGWIRSNPDEKSYKEEVTTFLRWYFKEINEHLNQYGGNKNFDAYLTELKERSGKGGGKEAQLEEKKQYYDYARAVFDQLRSSNYSPIFSGSDKGMRLDILSAQVVPSGGESKIRLPVVVWGAQRELRDDGKMKKMMTAASFHQTWKIFDAKGKLHGELSVDGDPAMKIDWPERYIREFPAQMILGHYDVDLLPAEAAKLEISFNIMSRSASGGDAGGNFTWKLDVPNEWKLAAGSQWKGAQEDVRSAEEIDPSKAAQTQR